MILFNKSITLSEAVRVLAVLGADQFKRALSLFTFLYVRLPDVQLTHAHVTDVQLTASSIEVGYLTLQSFLVLVHKKFSSQKVLQQGT